MQLFLFFVVVILALFGSIHLQNPDLIVTMKFIVWPLAEKPISLILAVPFAIGILIGAFMFVPPWMKKASLARNQKKRIQELEAEIVELAVPADTEEDGEVIVEGSREEV